MCYKNGGGAFVLAYLCFLFLVGVPIMMLEVSMGQFMSRGGIEAWDMVPLFKGVGLAALCVTVYINIYYIVILAWILSYMLDTIVALFRYGFPRYFNNFNELLSCEFVLFDLVY